jgi:hypothetical protein
VLGGPGFSNSKARDHLDLLREASVRLGSTLDVVKTAQELAELAIPVLADYLTVDLPEAMLPGTEPLQRLAATETGSPVFRPAGVASVHDGAPESLWERKETVFVPPRSPFTEVLHSRRPHFEPLLDNSPGTWLDLDPDRARTIHAIGMHSLIVIPPLWSTTSPSSSASQPTSSATSPANGRRRSLVRRFRSFADAGPWAWSAADADAFFAEARDQERQPCHAAQLPDRLTAVLRLHHRSVLRLASRMRGPFQAREVVRSVLPRPTVMPGQPERL